MGENIKIVLAIVKSPACTYVKARNDPIFFYPIVLELIIGSYEHT